MSQSFAEICTDCLLIEGICGLHQDHSMTVKNLARDFDDMETPPHFSVVAILDGHQAEMRVQEAFRWLRESFNGDVKMHFNAWNFCKLEVLDTRAMSVRIGASADIIMIAVTGAASVPDHVQRWIESIYQQQRQNRALLIALEDDRYSLRSHTNTLCSYVQQEAQRWQTGFMCCQDFQHPTHRKFIIHMINLRLNEVALQEEGDISMPSAPDTSGTVQEPDRPQSFLEAQAGVRQADIPHIREAAYQLWLDAGRPAGRELEFWLQAESLIKAG